MASCLIFLHGHRKQGIRLLHGWGGVNSLPERGTALGAHVPSHPKAPSLKTLTPLPGSMLFHPQLSLGALPASHCFLISHLLFCGPDLTGKPDPLSRAGAVGAKSSHGWGRGRGRRGRAGNSPAPCGEGMWPSPNSEPDLAVQALRIWQKRRVASINCYYSSAAKFPDL